MLVAACLAQLANFSSNSDSRIGLLGWPYAARMGRTVALVEQTTRLGGMLGAGLCHLDKRYFASVSGIIREWCDRNRDYYLTQLPDDPIVRAPTAGFEMSVRLGTKFEPHIAEKHFRQLVAEAKRTALGLVQAGWVPPRPRSVKVPGSAVICGAGDFWRDAPYRGVTIDPFPCRDQHVLFKRQVAWVTICKRGFDECGSPRCMEALGVRDVLEAPVLAAVGAALDPVAKIPETKVCAVRVETCATVS